MRTITPPNGVTPEFWGLVRLLERVIRQARKDARKGDWGAIDFMNTVCPQWQKEVRQNERKSDKKNFSHTA